MVRMMLLLVQVTARSFWRKKDWRLCIFGLMNGGAHLFDPAHTARTCDTWKARVSYDAFANARVGASLAAMTTTLVRLDAHETGSSWSVTL